MARMPDGFIDLTVTSPPYDNLRTYNGYEFDFEPIARELFRVTKKGGGVVWVVGDATINGSETGTSFRQALYFKEIGFNLHDTMIYQKIARFPEVSRYYQSFEYMFVFSKNTLTFNPLIKTNLTFGRLVNRTDRRVNGKTVQNPRFGNSIKSEGVRPNVWFIDAGYMRSSRDEVAFEHPAIFPEALARDHILSWSNENDLIYDPFMGSGTTAKAAHQLNRRWIGSEISAEYVELANKRLEPYLMQESLFQ